MIVKNSFSTYGILFWGLILVASCSSWATEPWSWVYSTTFDVQEQANNSKKAAYVLTKDGLIPFTQLIFSWNALRPIKGYYSFWIQGRDNGTGNWSSWHKMMVWGAKLQRSFLSKSDAIAQHVHVRFEAHNGKKLSGFRIKIRSHNGADLGYMQSISASCADFAKFKPEDVQLFTHLTTVRVRGVPRRSQFALNHPESHRLCSPTSCVMLVESLAIKKCDMCSFARNVHDSGLDAYGSWPFNTAHAFEHSKGEYWYRVVRYNSFSDLYDQLVQGFPAVVSVRGSIKGAPKSYDAGHLLVVVGFDARTQRVICHDPACKRDSATLRSYPFLSFLRAWESSRRLAYQVESRL
jgi:hypothetical protein